MRPIDETWERTEVYEVNGVENCNPVLNGSPTEVFLGTGPRLRLAAAAPEMARLILEKEYVEEGYDHHPCCPWCGMSKACDREVWPNGHKNEGDIGGGCPFVAVLRKAGVME